jgi:hypothetical protein
MRRLTRLAVVVVVLGALVAVPAARADYADEKALAERHAPIVKLVEQTEECGRALSSAVSSRFAGSM